MLVVSCCLEDAGLTFVELETVGLPIVGCMIGRCKMVVGSAHVDPSIDSGTVDSSGGSAAVDLPDDLAAVDYVVDLVVSLPTFSVKKEYDGIEP